MYSIAIAFLLLFVASVSAVPSWEAARGQTNIGSLVPGASYIEAVGPYKEGQYHTQHLTILKRGKLFMDNHHNPPSPDLRLGEPGNMTVQTTYRGGPPLFYINQNQLWLFNNATSILPVNALNTTKKAGQPLQLIVGKKRAGSRSGFWRWQGTMLHYEEGRMGNGGIFYTCEMEDGTSGVFMFLEPYVVYLYQYHQHNLKVL
ncbi:hypothetical protein H0H81_005024 [Sphagnurus paluster]|uniref:Uncharacterized protein n=1 Tax=Sphagnurus paluster TaxID=117069 RepID=A0A9P7GPU9_9AGAR|nr:hypothetical protein H0H81_005024 [Sphagnurus paluster]